MKRFLLFICLVSFMQQGITCSCVYPTEISKAFLSSKTVAHGEVVELKITKVSDSMDPDSLNQFLKNEKLRQHQSELLNSNFIIQVKFKIIELFKGDIKTDTLILYTTRTSASCGYTNFEIGKQFIIYSCPTSYFFSSFYSTQKNRKLEKANSNWVTSCSLTSELREDHLNALKVIKIAKDGINILKNNNLLKNEVKIYTSVFTKNYEEKYEVHIFEDDKLIDNNELNRYDLILTLLSIKGDFAELNFKSFDDGGRVISGIIKLRKNKDKWMKESINYVTAID
jgi:hypothetical protein